MSEQNAMNGTKAGSRRACLGNLLSTTTTTTTTTTIHKQCVVAVQLLRGS
jgi:hypothetical protein